jgi:hypothetical protein
LLGQFETAVMVDAGFRDDGGVFSHDGYSRFFRAPHPAARPGRRR